MSRENWIWMPHAGHFILGRNCMFRLNTYVNGYIVSTVGELWMDRDVRKINAEIKGEIINGRGEEWDYNYFKKFGYDEVGCDRLYETMVFKAQKNESDKCGCPYRIIVEDGEKDFDAYNDAKSAYRGHYAMCEKWDKC